MRITVSVTAEDIAKGKPCSCGHCPVALATQRATGQYVEASGSYVDSETHWAEVPASVARFISRFDSQCAGKPFSFEINWAPKSWKSVTPNHA